MSRVPRREFLKLGAAGAAGLFVTARAHASEGGPADPAPQAVPEDRRAFPLGVASGDASSSTAELWTHHEGAGPLRLVVWAQGPGGFQQVVHHDVPALASRGAVQISVDRLKPGQEHRYAFYTLDEHGRPLARSRVGRVKTAPMENALRPVTLGATCCTMNGMSQRVLEAAGRRRDLDLLLQLGDAVYADGSHTLDDFRARWRDNLSKRGWQTLRASTSLVATWDDHEVDNDWDPETIATEKLQAARGSFFEHMPLCHDDKCPERIWRSRRFGQTVEVFVLDSRGERKRTLAPRQYISSEQMEWLKVGLKESPAMFKVVANTVPITRFPKMFSSSIQDRWETFPEQRLELLSFIEGEQIPGVLFLAGDFHLAMIGRASPHGVGAKTMEILAGPGAQMGHPLVPWLFGRQFDWASNRNNVAALHFDPLRERVEVEFQGASALGLPEVFHRAAYRRRASLGFDKVDDWLMTAGDEASREG